MTSGTESRLNAITGVPHSIASIMTRPNGLDHSIGNRSACAPERNSGFCCSLISPRNSTFARDSSGVIVFLKYSWSALSIFAAIFKGRPLYAAISMARSVRFSEQIRPRNARYFGSFRVCGVSRSSDRP